MKLCPVTDTDGSLLLFWCPGCESAHPFWIKPRKDGPGHVWHFNGDMVRPTFAPSLLVNGHSPGHPRCHLFLENGELRFLGDCDHPLAGKTVPLPDWPYDKEPA